MGWRGTSSLRAYVDSSETLHILRLLGADISKFGKSIENLLLLSYSDDIVFFIDIIAEVNKYEKAREAAAEVAKAAEEALEAVENDVNETAIAK